MKTLFLNLNNEIDFYKDFKHAQHSDDEVISLADVDSFKQAKFFLKHVSLFHALFIIEKILEIILTISLMIIAPLWDKGYICSNTSLWNLLLFPYVIVFITSLILMLMDWRFPFSYSKNDLKQNLD